MHESTKRLSQQSGKCPILRIVAIVCIIRKTVLEMELLVSDKTQTALLRFV